MSYTERQISFENEGQKLYGFLHLPGDPGPHPAVALLHGFGGNHIEPHALFPKAARALASAGIAALRFDFRGSGDSEGLFQDASIQTEIDDAHAGIEFLRVQPQVDATRLALLGLSLGGLVAACAAASRPDIRALVLWSAVAHLGELFMASSSPNRLEHLEQHGYTDAGGLALGRDFVQQAMTVDPVTSLASWGGPVLIAHGTADATVPLDHAYRYKTAAGDRAELMLLDGADHVFSGLPWEEAVIGGSLRWLARRLLTA